MIPKHLVERLVKGQDLAAELPAKRENHVAWISIIPLFPEQGIRDRRDPKARFKVEVLEVPSKIHAKFINGFDIDIRDAAEEYELEFAYDLTSLEEVLLKYLSNIEVLLPSWKTPFFF